jgi:atypical dual specificity phosphatase
MASPLQIAVRFPRQLWTYATLKRVSWLEDGKLAACRYPRDAKSLRQLSEQGVTVLVNLHEQAHAPDVLAQHGLTEIHLPVADFQPPTADQLEQGVVAIEAALAAGKRVAVHCGAGLGRTGTLLACYLVKQGLKPEQAIARIRALRPGSVETQQQEAAVSAYARRLGAGEIMCSGT